MKLIVSKCCATFWVDWSEMMDVCEPLHVFGE